MSEFLPTTYFLLSIVCRYSWIISFDKERGMEGEREKTIGERLYTRFYQFRLILISVQLALHLLLETKKEE